MKILTIIRAVLALTALCFLFVGSVEAKQHHHKHSHGYNKKHTHKHARKFSRTRYVTPARLEERMDDRLPFASLGDFFEGSMVESEPVDRPVTRKPGKRKHAISKRGYRESYSGPSTRLVHGNLGPRPGRWCGYWMRQQYGGGQHLNVAWNWSRVGRAANAQVGAIVVWPHHVGRIIGQTARGWIVQSGNDGGRVRERVRSVAGAVFRVLD